MLIKELYVKNFKSIASIDITLNPLTLLVGANAAGKSNLISIFRFISDLTSEGIENAIALQGGTDSIRNISLPKDTPIHIGFSLDFTEDLLNEKWIGKSNVNNIGKKLKEVSYQFSIQPNKKGSGYRILSDILRVSYDCILNNSTDIKLNKCATLSLNFEKKTYKSSITSFCNINNVNQIDEETQKKLMEDQLVQFFARFCNENKKELMLSYLVFLLPPFFSKDLFIRIFDFDPKELKKPSSIAAVKDLAENGSNIANVLEKIIKNKEKKKNLSITLSEFLPFVDSITVENNMDRSYSYKISESYTKKAFHANFLSDGTVSILAIVIALYFEEFSNIIILEEPERNIHPKLLCKIHAAAEDVSSSKQVIITTHNPEFLKCANIENVKLITRDSEGFTHVTSPCDNEMVKCFIENELGLDDLFIQDLLGD